MRLCPNWLGKAKTGTTFLSKAIQNSLTECGHVLEPKGTEPCLFDPGRKGNLVVEVIYEHWDARPNLRWALFNNELPLTSEKKVLIVRDPRAELISRLPYIVRPLRGQGRLEDDKLREWMAVLARKERDPSALSIVEMIDAVDTLFETDFLTSFVARLNALIEFFKVKPRDIFAVKVEAVIDCRSAGHNVCRAKGW